MHCTKALLLTLLAGGDFSGELALRHATELVRLGPRTPGSAAHRKAQDYIRAQLKRLGCQILEDPFEARTPYGPVAMNNLIARLPGSSGKAVVFSGHYDTKTMPAGGFVGANDGGASAGLLLELAEVLAGGKRVHDVYLVWFDGEEAYVDYTPTDGLYGSRHLARRWEQDSTLRRIVALVNVDMIGDKDLGILKEQYSDRALVELIWSVAARLGFGRHFLPAGGAVLDDHYPFVERGVPAANLIDFDYGPGNAYWHTPADTPDKLSAASFRVVGRVLLEVLARLEARPAPR
jgi:glutaminyl-peptide cyclotransferase